MLICFTWWLILHGCVGATSKMHISFWTSSRPLPHEILHQLGLPLGLVLVLRMIHHVLTSQPFRLVYERPLLRITQQLPLGAQHLGYLRVVQTRIVVGDVLAADPGPHHEGVHRSLDVDVGRGFGHVVGDGNSNSAPGNDSQQDRRALRV